jgi:hypothetical protein
VSVALVTTVRDERSMLRANLLYHRFLGVDTCYVYDDGSRDGTLESVSDLPFAVTRPSVEPDEAPPWPHLARARQVCESFFVGRQMLNTAHAMVEARHSGFEWLLMIDADELVVVDRHHALQGSLGRALAGLPEPVQAAIFRPLESVQRRVSHSNVMAEETMFKRVDRRATRDTFDPFANRVRRIRSVFGHVAGKSALRLDVAACPRNSHRFATAAGRPLREEVAGDLLHYYAADFEDFVRKFRTMKDHPDRQLHGGEVVLQKRLWRDVVNRSGWAEAQLREYYERWVAFSEPEIERMSASKRGPWRQPLIVEVTSARDVVRSLTAGGSG